MVRTRNAASRGDSETVEEEGESDLRGRRGKGKAVAAREGEVREGRNDGEGRNVLVGEGRSDGRQGNRGKTVPRGGRGRGSSKSGGRKAAVQHGETDDEQQGARATTRPRGGGGVDGRAVSRARGRLRRSASMSHIPALVENDHVFEDDQDDIGKTLHVKDGMLGMITSRGFKSVTNFILDIGSQVYSENHEIKGYEVLVKRSPDSHWIDFQIPEEDIYNPNKFKQWLNKAHLRLRWKLQCNAQSWQDMIEKRIDHFEATQFKEKELVEKVGYQTQTSMKNPHDLQLRRCVLGPNLYFKSDGTKDENPIHYFGNGTLSNKLSALRVLRKMDIEVDETMSLDKLVEAHMPDNEWQHIGTAGMVMSCSNADAVRVKTKQHPSLVLQGDMGVGKSSSQDVCMFQLCGAKEVFKIDCDTKNTTVKRIAAKQTFPICIEDNNSENKEENLTNACFDAATYHVKGEEIVIETPIIVTTNLEYRSERAADRQVINRYVQTSANAEQLLEAERKYNLAMRAQKVPVGANIRYGSFVLSDEFDQKLEEFVAMEMEINGCKKRTARGYALKDAAVWHIMQTNPQVFSRLGLNWDGDERSYCHFLRTTQKDSIRKFHMELTRAIPLCNRYLENVCSLIEGWPKTQVLRSVIVVSSEKHKEHRKCRYVLAIRQGEVRFQNVGGISMELIKKVISNAGGVSDQRASSFLSLYEEYEPEIGITKEVTQCHQAMLFLIVGRLSSSLIMRFADCLDSESLRQLADVETPTCTTNILEPQGKGRDDESEDYNDISMLLSVDTPVNSTAVDKSSIPEGSPEISRIEIQSGQILTEEVPSRSSSVASRLASTGDGTHVSQNEEESSLFSNDLSEGEQLRCQCGKTFLSSGGLTKHKKVCRKPSVGDTILLNFQCKLCKKTFNQSRYLKLHENSKRCEARQSFLERTATTTSLESVSMSLVLSESAASQGTEATSLECDHCGKLCKNKAGKTIHMKRCKEMTSSEANGVSRKEVNCVKKCNTCGCEFDNLAQFKLHQVDCKQISRRLSTSLPESQLFSCQKCGKNDLKTKQALASHFRFCKGKSDKPDECRRLSVTLPMNNQNVCGECGEKCDTPTGLKIHEMSHK